MSLRAALLLTALPTLAAAQDIDTSEIHACVASCVSGRSTVEFVQYGQCIADLCASLATGTGAASEMAEAVEEAPEASDIQNETFLLLGDEADGVEAEEPAPQPVVSANAGVNVDAPAESNVGGDTTMNAVPVPVEVEDDATAEGGDGADDGMNADIAEAPAADPQPAARAGDGGDDAMNADIAESPTEDVGEEMADAEDATEDMASDDSMAANDTMDEDVAGAAMAEDTAEDTMADDTGADVAMADAATENMADAAEAVADSMADDATSPDIVADDAMAEDAGADVAMADDAMADDAKPADVMAEDTSPDATNQIISGDAATAEPVADPVSAAEWQVVTLNASEAPWVDGYGAVVAGDGGVQFGYLCARAGVSHLSLSGETVSTRPGVYTVIVGQAQYLTPPMVATGGRLQGGISPNDPLLAALRAGNEVDVYGPDRALVARFALRGSSAAIATALESCF